MKKPIQLHLACGLLITYIVVDTILSFGDSRVALNTVILALMSIPAIVFCWRGHHLGYLFCVVLSVLLTLAPLSAELNAPDRILIPADIPVAILLMLLLLNKSMREYFKFQRAQWQLKQKSKTAHFDDWQPLFVDDQNSKPNNEKQLFWQTPQGIIIFLPNKLKLTAYRIEDRQKAETIYAEISPKAEKASQRQRLLVPWTAITLIIFVLVFFLFSDITYILASISLCIALFLPIPIYAKINMSELHHYYKKLAKDLEPTNDTVTPFQLLDIYSRHSPNQTRKFKKMVAVAGLLIVTTWRMKLIFLHG